MPHPGHYQVGVEGSIQRGSGNVVDNVLNGCHWHCELHLAGRDRRLRFKRILRNSNIITSVWISSSEFHGCVTRSSYKT